MFHDVSPTLTKCFLCLNLTRASTQHCTREVVSGLLIYLRATVQISARTSMCLFMRNCMHAFLLQAPAFVIVYTTPQQDSRAPLPALACGTLTSLCHILLLWTPSSLNKSLKTYKSRVDLPADIPVSFFLSL